MKKKIFIIIAILLVVAGAFVLNRYVGIDYFVTLLESIRANPFAPFIFVIVYGVSVTFAAPASVLTILSVPLFGFWGGALMTILGSNLGCHMSYWIAKLLGEKAVSKFVKSGSFIESAKEKATKNGFIFMMYARLIPLFPFAAVNYLSGIIGIKYSDFAIATFIGMLPGTFVYVYLSYSAVNIRENPLGIIVSVGVLVLFTVIITVVKKKTTNKDSKNVISDEKSNGEEVK